MRSIVIILILLQVVFSYADDKVKVTGTYSSLFYHKEAGDLLGNEIRIVLGKKGYEGTFQTAQGEPDTLVFLKNISIKGNLIKFTISEGSLHAGEFSGEITKTELKGVLTLQNGNKIPLVLKKGKSYWD